MDVKEITAKYQAHKNTLTDTKLISPCNGYIQKRLFEPGETVRVGTPVIAMISDTMEEIEINIPSSEYVRRHLFDSFLVLLIFTPERYFL